MAANKVLLVDQKGTQYVFNNNGTVQINGVNKGKGKLVTDISEIRLRTQVNFVLEHKRYNTLPIKAAAIND